MHSSHKYVLGHKSSDIAQKTQDALQDVKRLVKAREKKACLIKIHAYDSLHFSVVVIIIPCFTC